MFDIRQQYLILILFRIIFRIKRKKGESYAFDFLGMTIELNEFLVMVFFAYAKTFLPENKEVYD